MRNFANSIFQTFQHFKISAIPNIQNFKKSKNANPDNSPRTEHNTGAALTKDESLTFPGKLPKSKSGRWIRHMPSNWTILKQGKALYPGIIFPAPRDDLVISRV